MTKEKLKQLIAIRDNAPDGAIGINRHCDYIYHALGVRSLDDIELIIEQAEYIEELERQLKQKGQ